MLRPQVGIYGAERKVAVDLADTRYDKVVEALGGHGEYCEKPEEIRPALERSFASGIRLINVKIRKMKAHQRQHLRLIVLFLKLRSRTKLIFRIHQRKKIKMNEQDPYELAAEAAKVLVEATEWKT